MEGDPQLGAQRQTHSGSGLHRGHLRAIAFLRSRITVGCLPWVVRLCGGLGLPVHHANVLRRRILWSDGVPLLVNGTRS